MTQVIQEWLKRSEEDWQIANLLIQSDLDSYGSICFHAQQCIEKLMKALLIQVEVVPPYSHDLLTLDRMLSSNYPNWQVNTQDLAFLTQYAVAARYPGLDVDRKDALDCISKCAKLRSTALTFLQ